MRSYRYQGVGLECKDDGNEVGPVCGNRRGRVSSLFDRIRKEGTLMSVNAAPGSGQGASHRIWPLLIAGAVLVTVWELSHNAEVAIGAAALAAQLAAG
jgi:hypothetical protein